MTEPRLDVLAKSLAHGFSRRRLLAGLGGGGIAAGGLLAFPRSALVCQRIDAACDEARTCCAGATCQGDRCACRAGWEECGGSGFCVDPTADENHCGRCGNRCAGGETCCAGRCVDAWREPANCGACGVVCAENELCVRGACLSCPLATVPCGDVCCQRGRCDDGRCLAA
jgi:hypothetical protein